MLNTISHPTDFSPEGQAAFQHALRLALASQAKLDLLHVRSPHADKSWNKFPRVREVLERWGVLAPGAHVADIETQSGIRVQKVEILDADAVEGLSRFLIGHRPDLLVMASHGRDGLNRWLSGSVSAQVAHETRVPTLLFGPNAKPFVDEQSGTLNLNTVLVPIAHDPAPGEVLKVLLSLTQGQEIRFDIIHVGQEAPEIRDATGAPLSVRCLEGPLVETILTAADEAQMIAMPTAGHQGFLDVLRGSTTEQVVQRALCPVLALPTVP